LWQDEKITTRKIKSYVEICPAPHKELEAYSRNVSDEAYSRNVSDEAYSRNVSDEAYSRNVSYTHFSL
jgi:hypothetical protein